jgi:hypothetical protein
MDLRAPLQLQSMIKSMTDVVLPALDPANRMAQEQAQLILGMLHLMSVRLPLQFHYDVDELKRYLALSRELLDSVHGGPLTSAGIDGLARAAADADAILARAQTAPAGIEAAALALRTQVSALVEQLWHDGEPGSRESASKAVLAAARQQVERERAWFVPQGWDADASSFAPIERLINYPAGSAREPDQ